jgi:hypothetical protein
MLRKFMFGALVVCLASLATAGVPDYDVSTATIDPNASGASMYNLPNGGGNSFTEARVQGVGQVDATISLTLYDTQGNLIFGYPFEDMWLETSGGGLAFCEGGTAADASTDINGETQWQNPLNAGGSSGGETTWVMIAGQPLNNVNLNLTFNSPDISGDLQVNASDVAFFVPLIGGTDYRGDFNNDGNVNVSDIAFFVPGLGTSCE